MVCDEIFAKRIGVGDISLYYDDDAQDLIPLELDVKIGKLRNFNLIYKRRIERPAAEEKDKVVAEHEDASEIDTEASNLRCKKVGLLVGRTGVGKSLLGCVLTDKYEESGFKVSHDPTSCTKFTEFRTNVERNITIHDTKGLFDTDYKLENDYNEAEEGKKLQIIEEIMDAIGTLLETGLHAILLVVRVGSRFDEREKELIDQLATYLFQKQMRHKVYLIFTNSPAKYVKDKQKGIDWLDKQQKTALKSYYDAVEGEISRIFFVDNKDPEDAADQEEMEKYKNNNIEMAQEIIDTLHKNGNEKFYLLDVYTQLSEEYTQLKEPAEKRGINITYHLRHNGGRVRGGCVHTPVGKGEVFLEVKD